MNPICSSDLADKMKVNLLSNLLDELSQNQNQLIDNSLLHHTAEKMTFLLVALFIYI